MNLFIVPSWYPHRCHPFEGIYVRDQAMALGELRPSWHLVISSHCQGRGHVTVAHARHSPRCIVESLIDRRPRSRALSPNVTEEITPRLTWPAKIAGGNRAGILSANVENFERSVSRGWRPDLVHAHVSFPGGWIAMELSRRYKLPYVITEHMGPFPVPVYRSPDGGLASWIREPLVNADERIAVSAALARTMEAFGLQSPKVIPNLVDERLHLVAERGTQRVQRFFTLCGMEASKGVPDLVRAASELLPRLPEADRHRIRFRMGGIGPSRKHFEHLARQLRVHEHFEWLGQLSREESAREFAACDCFVLPSHHESFGVVFVEAMAHGKPVVATRCGGPDSIVEPDTGVLVDVGKPAALAAALEDMACGVRTYDPRIIRERFERRYSRRVVVDALDTLYRDVLSRRGSRSGNWA